MTFRIVPWVLFCALTGLMTSCQPPRGSSFQPSGASSAPTPSPEVTASPLPSPGPLHAVAITVTPATADLFVAPPRGMTPQHPYSIRLEAEVTYSDGSMDDEVEWTSMEGDRARIDQMGVVTAGLEPGVVVIRVESEDARASASVIITVKDDSAAEVTVD